MTSSTDYEALIRKARALIKPAAERNIFSICGRGHYENPTSDLLAFFINPKEEHGFGTLFLRSFLEATDITASSLEMPFSPIREERTDRGNRLDIIVEGSDWVLAIENKIRHHLANPLHDYIEHIRNRYRQVPECNRHFIVLSIRDERQEDASWKTLTWRTYVDCIKKNVASSLTAPTNLKWQVIMREFLLNIEQECGDESMSEGRITLVREHYREVVEIQEMHKEYLAFMTRQASEALKFASCPEPWTKQENWGKEGIALRLYSRALGDKSNIALLLRKDGGLRIQFYVHDISDTEVEHLKGEIDSEKFRKYWEESPNFRCFGLYDGATPKTIFAEITILAETLRRFYEHRQISQI